MNSQFDREIEELERQLDAGEITSKEYWKEVHELQRDYRAAAEEAAEQAYRDTLDSWY